MKRIRAFTVQNGDDQPFVIVINGRVCWAMEQLMDAGETGITPMSRPAPRWASYVFDLRGEGVAIETIHEKHTGEFSGTHARYVLRSRVLPGRHTASDLRAAMARQIGGAA